MIRKVADTPGSFAKAGGLEIFRGASLFFKNGRKKEGIKWQSKRFAFV
ncbi:hypothetical protein NBRC111894_3435 [Sporolactobacillus inulinus]|uniref:Uncharacterized protein n=1 Tax=Sporolactobacillus inulinus TaxID=2078 RepID=A0A4Y1ZG00_9BACL|nr:hypothetical protein NBRC111894_3435 [Sporolactobacillus inulinus]